MVADYPRLNNRPLWRVLAGAKQERQNKMAYDNSKPFTYGIPNGTYVGKPTTASCYERNGALILDIKFAVKDPQSGEWFKKDNGYNWEAQKRHWLTNAEGAFHEATINGLREWAKGWNPTSFDDFYWFQNPSEDGTPFGNLEQVGEVELNFTTNTRTGGQDLWVHDPNRPRTGRKVFTPDGAETDAAKIKAKWGSKAKALFSTQAKPLASTPKTAPVAAPAPARATAAPKPAAAPVAKPAASPWASFPQNADGAFAYYCSLLGEPYESAKHDDKWFGIYDSAAQGKDPDQFTPADVQRLFEAVQSAM